MSLFKKIKYLSFLLFTSFSFSATAEDITDFGAIVPGQVYEYQAKMPVAGTYSSPQSESRLLRCYSSGDNIVPYRDAEHTDPVEADNSFYGPYGEKVKIYPIPAGTTYYFYNGYPLQGGNFRLEDEKEEIKFAGASPAVSDSPLSLSENYRLTLLFNTAVKCTKCKLEAGGRSAEVPVQMDNSSITISWFDTLLDWYHFGVLNEGTELTVTLTGIRDEYDSSNRPDFGDGLGKLVLRYVMAAKPAELVEEINTPAAGVPDFMTYYLPGSPEGMVTLVFDEPLSAVQKPKAVLTYGSTDNIDFGIYEESLPVSVEGNALTVDLSGRRRLPEDMIPGLDPLPNIYLSITNIKSEDGQYVLTGKLSNPYSFGFNYNLKSVVYSIAADWMPLPGSVLHPGDDMEIWVLNGSRIAFDSVDFQFMQGGETTLMSVSSKSMAVAPDPSYPDAVIFTLKAPEFVADSGSDITVTFGGMICADGLDHSSDILAVFKSDPSGVESIESEVSAGDGFDIFGRKASRNSKGIIIIDGKKVIR